jgi:hypothetical protein
MQTSIKMKEAAMTARVTLKMKAVTSTAFQVRFKVMQEKATTQMTYLIVDTTQTVLQTSQNLVN